LLQTLKCILLKIGYVISNIKTKIMNLKFLTISAFFIAMSSFAMAQETESRFASPVKGSLIGFGVNLTDYSASLPHVGKVDVTASLMYWKGLTQNLDLSVRFNGWFSTYAKPERTKEMSFIPELEGSLHLRALSDDHLFNPFLSAGVGVGRYSKSFVPYAPLGAGLQVNVMSETYFFLQANYRFSFQDTKLDNNMFYSFGVAAPINYGKKKIKEIPVVVVDTDGDGTPDATDECPSIAGVAQFNGCPDKDQDGIADKNDKCPDVAGVAKYDGCPIPDTDGDGINDENDKCPSVAGVAGYNGCPIPDSDSDGVNDEMDKCPTTAGPQSNQGCPEVKEETRKRLAFAAKAIQFETGKAVIKKQSYKVLDEIADILNEYPDYKMTMDGYTDNVGKPAKNLELSKNRANAVKAYFVNKGIADDRLEADGHGDANPIASNKTAKGRAQNRRVEMDMKLK
jgi:OOP family OmpA-OmpF porin